MENALPSPAHCEHRVRTVTVQEKCLAEDAQHPVGHEKYDNLKHSVLSTANLEASNLRLNTPQHSTPDGYQYLDKSVQKSKKKKGSKKGPSPFLAF